MIGWLADLSDVAPLLASLAIWLLLGLAIGFGLNELRWRRWLWRRWEKNRSRRR